MTDANYDARDFQSSSFFKKEEVRRDGPKILAVQAIEQGEGFAKNGKPPKPVLQLVFPDDRRLSLGTQANLNRMIEFFGPLTSGWIGKVVTLYYSPDVRGPNGEEGGIRLRLPETRPAPPTTASTYADALTHGVPFEQSELPAAPKRAGKGGTR